MYLFDAIQVMPTSNLNKGPEMLMAMETIGDYAMTLGNHEFDFGMDTILALRDGSSIPMLSNTVSKDDLLLFDKSEIVSKRSAYSCGLWVLRQLKLQQRHSPTILWYVTFLDLFTQIKDGVKVLEPKP